MRNKTKEKLLEVAVKKVSLDPRFIAFHFRDIKDPQRLLGCSRIDYLRLALCLVPKSREGLGEIVKYIGLKFGSKNFLQKFFWPHF